MSNQEIPAIEIRPGDRIGGARVVSTIVDRTTQQVTVVTPGPTFSFPGDHLVTIVRPDRDPVAWTAAGMSAESVATWSILLAGESARRRMFG